MGAVESTDATVESYLSTLGETYSSFAVNQTTLAVCSARYEREVEHAGAGCITVYTKVHNDSSEVLHVDEDESLELPSTTIQGLHRLEPAAREAVEETAGIECSLARLEQATIFGIRDADDPSRGTVYSLAVVFEATYESGPVEDEAVWQPTTDLQAMYA